MMRPVMLGLLVASTALAAPDSGGRQLLGWCRGAHGPSGLLVETRVVTVPGGVQWNAQFLELDSQPDRVPVTWRSEVVEDVGFMPALNGLSWRDLSDGSTRIWMRDLSASAQPAARAPGMAALSVERSTGPCEGAAFLLDPVRDARVGSMAALLMVPREAVALTALHDGKLLTMPLVASAPARRKSRRPQAPLTPGGLAADGQILLERTEPQRVGSLVIGRAWRVMTLPSRSAGRLTSERYQVLEEKGRTRVVHQVRGVVELDRGTGELEGILIEILP